MRRTIIRTLLPAATAALVLAGGTLSATAQHADHSKQIDRSALLEHHPDLDRDGDGKLSDDELHQAHEGMQDAATKMFSENDLRIFDRAEVLKRFPKADRNADGSLDDEELRRAIMHVHMRRAAEARKRHAGKLADIDRDEVLRRHPEADADGNGEISNEELHKAFARLHGEGAGASKMHSADDLRLIDRAAMLELYPGADSDGDGALSDKEVHHQVAKLIGRHDSDGPAHAEMNLRNIDREEVLKRHPEIDADNDGKISDAELHELFSRMHEDRGGHDKK